MQTRHDIGKIRAIKPSIALMPTHKKGFVPGIVIAALALIGLAAGAKWAYNWITEDDGGDTSDQTLSSVQSQSASDLTVSEKDALSCDGVKSVNALFNDINAYKQGTDPSGNLTILERNDGDDGSYQNTVNDDATSTSVPVLSDYTALAHNYLGTPETGYFAEEVEFSTVCVDEPIQVELYPASAPTMTVVNDNGKTINADATTHEAMDASTTYTPCITIRAPTEACASRFGAYVFAEYDATYVNTVNGVELDSSNQKYRHPHVTNHSESNLDFDTFESFFYPDEFCNGAKDEICFQVTTTSSTPGEDQANVKFHWVPVNKDLDGDHLTLIEGIYDEDNNFISLGNTSTTYYGS